jgi:hypothetical protein
MNEELQKQIDELRKKLNGFMQDQTVVDHQHTGFDTTRVDFSDIALKKIYIHETIAGTAAATAANYGIFYIVPAACVVTDFKEVHAVAGNDAGAVTLDLEKLSGTEAPDAGSSILGATLSLKATANTVQTGTMTMTLDDRSLAKGDRLCLKDAGTLTNVANVSILVELTMV